MNRIRILFLCTGNSARSILAEAIANQAFGDRLIASSAGSQPKREPHPMTFDTLRAHGLTTDWLTSKSWEVFRDQEFDLVITLCDAVAKEICPAFPGAPVQVHWGFPDPPAADDSKVMFEQVFAGLREALGSFILQLDQQPPPLAARQVSGELERVFRGAAMKD